MRRILIFSVLLAASGILIGFWWTDVGAASRLLATTKQITTIVVVRHAEKTSEGDDAVLTGAGQERAVRLASILERERIDAVFSSELKRTYQTVQPLAAKKELEVTRIQSIGDTVAALRTLPAGSFAVVAHHSHTVPAILKGLGVPLGEIRKVDMSRYDNLLFILTHPELEKRLLRLTY